MAENENSSELQPSDASSKDKKKKESEADGLYLPTLVEFVFTVSAITLVLLFLIIVGISIVTGATLLDTVIRTSVAMLVIGGLLMLISRQVFLEVLKDNSAVEEKIDPQPSEK